MELLQRCKEITRLQSELITEKKIIDNKLDSNIVQKFKLERRKFELIQKLQPPLPLPQVNVPPTLQQHLKVTKLSLHPRNLLVQSDQ